MEFALGSTVNDELTGVRLQLATPRPARAGAVLEEAAIAGQWREGGIKFPVGDRSIKA
jgi:hypothetical protein